MPKKQQGFALIIVLVSLAIVAILFVSSYYAGKTNDQQEQQGIIKRTQDWQVEMNAQTEKTNQEIDQVEN